MKVNACGGMSWSAIAHIGRTAGARGGRVYVWVCVLGLLQIEQQVHLWVRV